MQAEIIVSTLVVKSIKLLGNSPQAGLYAVEAFTLAAREEWKPKLEF